MKTFIYSPGENTPLTASPRTPAEAVLRVFPLAQPVGESKWHIGQPHDVAAAIREINAHLPVDNEVVLVARGDDKAEVLIGNRTTINQEKTKPAVLGIATICSVWVMMAWGGPQDLWNWDWAYALPGALGIVAILFAHEMGHHLAMRRLGIKVTYPYLIPFPLWWGGTFGGYVISDTPDNRRASLHLAAGGPLLGLLVTIPIAIVGLWLSERGALAYRNYTFEDGGFLWNLLVALIRPAGEGYLLLHPLAAAGYFGIFLTGLNLLPVFPLDGGRWVFTFIPPRLRRPFSIVAISWILRPLSIDW